MTKVAPLKCGAVGASTAVELLGSQRAWPLSRGPLDGACVRKTADRLEIVRSRQAPDPTGLPRGHRLPHPHSRQPCIRTVRDRRGRFQLFFDDLRRHADRNAGTALSRYATRATRRIQSHAGPRRAHYRVDGHARETAGASGERAGGGGTDRRACLRTDAHRADRDAARAPAQRHGVPSSGHHLRCAGPGDHGGVDRTRLFGCRPVVARARNDDWTHCPGRGVECRSTQCAAADVRCAGSVRVFAIRRDTARRQHFVALVRVARHAAARALGWNRSARLLQRCAASRRVAAREDLDDRERRGAARLHGAERGSPRLHQPDD